MKIDFSILWVDDNKDFVESLRPQLNKWIDSLGMELIIHWHPGESGIYEDLQAKDVELIVLDYKLKGSKKGDQIILDIRAKECYEDIIFYTTDSVPNNLFSSAAPDGVFFVEKKDAKERIIDVIKLKMRRASDLATVRGWIVADSIELEVLLVTILDKYFKKHKEMSQIRAMKVLSEDGAFFFGRLRSFLSEILKDHVAHLTFSDDGIFDFGGKHKILNGILKDHLGHLSKQKPVPTSLAKLNACKKTLDVFPKEIIEVRNALAHQIAEIADTGHKKIKTKTKEAKEIVITPEECAVMRKNVRKHLLNLQALEALI